MRDLLEHFQDDFGMCDFLFSSDKNIDWGFSDRIRHVNSRWTMLQQGAQECNRNLIVPGQQKVQWCSFLHVRDAGGPGRIL
jgi:hypothetical protein